MSKSKSSITRRRLGRAGLATGAATTLLTALSAAPAFAAAGTLTLSSTGGPTGGGNTIVATFATNPTSPNPTSFGSTTAAYFVAATTATATSVTCPTTYPSSAPATNLVATGSPALKVLAPNKIAVVVPAGVAVNNSINRYGLCTYSANTSGAALIASGQYTVGTKPKIDAVGAVSPMSGPALGGTTITVKGTGFVANTTAQPTNTTATIDGEPLTDIVVAGNGNSFTAKTPPHAAGGPFLLAVTTPGGSVNTLGDTTGKASLFNYSNGIVVSPNTAPNHNGSVDLDVLGVGFSNYSFEATKGGTTRSANGHVYLTAGGYNPLSNSGAKTNPELTECINVLVITDEELLCSLPLNHTFTNPTSGTTGVLTAATAKTGKVITATSGSNQITSPASGGTAMGFTQADVGMVLDAGDGTTTFDAGTLITAVASPTSATVSNNAKGNLVAGTGAGLTNARPIANVTVTNSTTLTAASGSFTQADIGRTVVSASALTTDPKLADNTTIIAIGTGGTTATLSAPITGTLPGSPLAADISVQQSVPVANGTYTITVVNDGAVGAQLSATYSQSIISSGSTFTVADY
ncbi:hypothetical protein Ait01nite_060680 [Actinoplanes italicus]|uniref:IPT/TIG domain-containing protein n=1 Tax=Actinoplanes italicus TaxID=113567 RepID=A0A2T0K6P7_9ACTN|nr:IPT/TIG domain-containing protein [Actinoplanes italicus]PRX18681.1 IPT/TIG domain-containing protein [Actinoplanes italicus]GIE33023.1 hypothetical protein Ait01nite_060680 [Actinoplanes italicus]